MAALLGIPPGAAYRMGKFFSPLPRLMPAVNPAAGFGRPMAAGIPGILPNGLYGSDLPAVGLSDPSLALSAGDGPAMPAGADSMPLNVPPPPDFDTPTLLPAPRPGMAVRAAVGLEGLPAFRQNPFESGGSRLGRGLLSGFANGFSKGTLLDYGNAAQNVSAANAASQAMADRNNALKLETWKARLKVATDEAGNWKMNPQLADAMGVPYSPDAPSMKPADVVKAIQTKRAADAHEAADPMVPVHDPAVAAMLGIQPGGTARQSRFLDAKKALRPSGAAAGGGAFGPNFDPEGIAQAIHDRNNPPDPSGFSRGQWGMIVSQYNKKFPGENLTNQIADWKSFTRNINTMQGTKFVAMGVNLNATDRAIALTRQYSDDLSKVAPRFANTPMNTLAQQLQQNYNFGGPQQQAAISRLVAQAEATRLQLASLYMAGGAPTDQAMRHASEILDYKKPANAFAAQLDVAQQDVLLRRGAYEDAALVRGQNPYSGVVKPTDWSKYRR